MDGANGVRNTERVTFVCHETKLPSDNRSQTQCPALSGIHHLARCVKSLRRALQETPAELAEDRLRAVRIHRRGVAMSEESFEASNIYSRDA